jgi:hypothetical protein
MKLTRRTRFTALSMIAACGVFASVLLTGIPAEAATVSLSGSLSGQTEAWYSTPRYKAVGGDAYMKATNSPSGGSGLYTGFRSSAASRRDDTQFPYCPIGRSVEYMDPDGVPYNYFGVGTYYFDAQNQGAWDSYSYTWTGTLTW